MLSVSRLRPFPSKLHQKDAATVIFALAALSADEINTRPALLRQAIKRGIRKDMRWQNTCKIGTSRFAFSTGAVCDEVMFRALRLPKDGKNSGNRRR
ncbi:hypothetical protein B0T25DRAFT_623617 [Lasiosphaeria hispida]|uniref:Uncharacterized protein n=1 Tax=Lasiosphaeria hispida TaxID=260671 RepID=A0AAJ0HK08_9PEZI|nr:hypothetical protein B0T25DRAFT_623617 [Lasiosphaeria hispida]